MREGGRKGNAVFFNRSRALADGNIARGNLPTEDR